MDAHGATTANPQVVQIPLTSALEVAALLEQLTVSLDRIGSAAGAGMVGPRILWEFTDAANTFRRANELRFVLWDACSAILGEERINEIAESISTFPQVGGTPDSQ